MAQLAAQQDDSKRFRDVFGRLLQQVVQMDASEMFLTADFPPTVRLDGKLTKLMDDPMAAEHCQKIARAICDDRRWQSFLTLNSASFVLSDEGARFRVNLFTHQRKVGLVAQRLPSSVQDIASLGLPQWLRDSAMRDAGLILVATAAGQGRTSVVQSMLHHRNVHAQGHILSVENMIEVPHKHINCMVTQREITTDTPHMRVALQDAFHQSVDAIFLGDIADYESLSMILRHADARLVVASIMADGVMEAVERLLSLATVDSRADLGVSLAMSLSEVYSHQLVPRQDENGVMVATERLLMSARSSGHLANGRMRELSSMLGDGRGVEVHSANHSLFSLYEQYQINLGEAVYRSNDRVGLRSRLRIESVRYDSEGGDLGGDGDLDIPQSDVLRA